MTPISVPGKFGPGEYYLANDIEVSGRIALSLMGPAKLDMAGRTIRNRSAHETGASFGIKATGRNLTITGGAITGFRFGVHSAAPETTICDVDFTGCLYIGAHLEGAGSKILSCIFAEIGGVSDEAYAIGVNVIGSVSAVLGNRFRNIYRQSRAAPDQVGEGCPILINASAGGCVVERNHLENEEARPDTIGIFAGRGGRHVVGWNVVRNFKTGLMGGRSETAPLSAPGNVFWMAERLAGSRAYYGDFGQVTENLIVGYDTPFDGTMAHVGCTIL